MLCIVYCVLCVVWSLSGGGDNVETFPHNNVSSTGQNKVIDE